MRFTVFSPISLNGNCVAHRRGDIENPNPETPKFFHELDADPKFTVTAQREVLDLIGERPDNRKLAGKRSQRDPPRFRFHGGPVSKQIGDHSRRREAPSQGGVIASSETPRAQNKSERVDAPQVQLTSAYRLPRYALRRSWRGRSPCKRTTRHRASDLPGSLRVHRNKVPAHLPTERYRTRVSRVASAMRANLRIRAALHAEGSISLREQLGHFDSVPPIGALRS
jgi:hypothetical protein